MLLRRTRMCQCRGRQDASTLAVLWQYGVDFVQGDYFQKPSDSLNYDFTGESGV